MSALIRAWRSCFTTLGAAVRFRVPSNRVELHPTPDRRSRTPPPWRSLLAMNLLTTLDPSTPTTGCAASRTRASTAQPSGLRASAGPAWRAEQTRTTLPTEIELDARVASSAPPSALYS